MALRARIAVAIDALLSGVVDVGAVEHAVQIQPGINLADGTAAGQATQMFTDTRTLGASATENLDLAGALSNAIGQSLTFTKVKALLISASASNTNDVVVGGAATNGAATFFGDATDKVRVKPGGQFLLTAPDVNGYAITAGTGDILLVANGGAGTGVTYDIVVIGVA